MILMKAWLRKNWKITIVCLLLIIGRIALSFSPAHSDIRIQAEWGKWMYVNGGVKGLYNWNQWGCIWPNHPPLISWVYFEAYNIHSQLMWWMSSLGNFIALHRLAPTKFIWFFDFIRWFGSAVYENTEYLLGVIIVIKQIMVVADFLVALLIFWLCKKNKIDWKKYVLAYLLLPFSWYLSSVWGQSNQLSWLFLLLSLVLMTTKRSIWAPLLYAIAINLKPDCIFLLPLYLVIWFKQKLPWRNLFLGGLLAGFFSLWTLTWFNKGNLVELLQLLFKRLNTAEGLMTFNAFNFWYIIYPYPIKIGFEDWQYFFISAKNWGYIIYITITLFSFKLIKIKKPETIFLSVFMVGFGSWLFMTGMHERYSFYSIVSLLVYSIYTKKYFGHFIVLSTITFLNMFYGFFPQQFGFIKTCFDWGGQVIPRGLSIINILIYFDIWRKSFGIERLFNNKKENKKIK